MIPALSDWYFRPSKVCDLRCIANILRVCSRDSSTPRMKKRDFVSGLISGLVVVWNIEHPLST